MRKYLFFLFLAIALSGCAKQTRPFALQWNETQITLGAPAEPVLEALGPVFGYSEHTRRYGVEKTYRFSGLQLHTCPGRDGERILGFLLTAPQAHTREGIAIGDTARQVRACYGEDSITGSCCTIHQENKTLTLLLQNNRVSQIGYSLPSRK